MRTVEWNCIECGTMNVGRADDIETYYQICRNCKTHNDIELDVVVTVKSVKHAEIKK